MPDATIRPRRIAYIAHSLRSDWNNGNAHFLRGLVRALHALGHDITAYEPESEWSIDNLRSEPRGEDALRQFLELYSEFDLQTYAPDQTAELWREHLRGVEFVLLHEWNPPALANLLLSLRNVCGYKLLFHDTHHRATSSPDAIAAFDLVRFDGVLAFGEALRLIYRERFGIERGWPVHEAADTTVFRPLPAHTKEQDVVWIGNWGEGERAAELREFVVAPATGSPHRFSVYGVRYPQDGLQALERAGIAYKGYLPNLDAPAVYAASRVALHVPRQVYSQAMTGIPTIRVFEALACGIPLVSAPWRDTEGLFLPGDYWPVHDARSTVEAIEALLNDPAATAEQIRNGRERVLSYHTCEHRARELTAIFDELRP